MTMECDARDALVCKHVVFGPTPLRSVGDDGVRCTRRAALRAAEGILKQEPNTKGVLGTRLETSRSKDLFKHS